MRLSSLLRALRRQDGISLVMAIGVLGVLSATGATVVYTSSTNARSAEFSQDTNGAYGLAEAGLNEMMAILSDPRTNGTPVQYGALNPALLPATTRTYDAGTVTWSGTLSLATATWSITSTGRIKNPTGATNDVTRTLSAKVPVTPTYAQPLNNPAWNYIYARRTGNACDMTVANNVGGSSRLYVAGNLCLSNNVGITTSSLIVQGNLDLSNNAYVGTSSSMSTRVETFVGGDCRYGGGAWTSPDCNGNQDSRRIYSKKDPPSYVAGVTSPAPLIAEPASDFPTWYQNAMPGPTMDCTSSNGARSGTPPVFENETVNPTRNNSVPTVFELTPASSYTCRVGPAEAPFGELSWNATSRVLTVAGTIYIDGSARVTNGFLNQYNGQATLYLSGTFLINNGSKLCGGVSGSNCDFAAWNPNTEMLTIVADGNGGQAGTGNSILIDNNAEFQGGLFATESLAFMNNARSDGPMVGDTVTLANNVTTDAFPTITTVPVGMPGNPQVYAQPNPPQLYNG
jgi:Tfp pilus assembly protein PilX